MIQTLRNMIVSLLAPKNRAQGIDGSHWWLWFKPETAKKPIDFMIFKATQGRDLVDPLAASNYEGAKQIEIRGAYHYQIAGVSWIGQADFFLRTIKGWDLHIWALDVEKYLNEGAFIHQTVGDTFFSDMRRIIDYLKTMAPAGVRVMLYTNTDIYQNYLVPSIKRLYGAEGIQWLESLDLWLASYNGQSVDGEPLMPTNRAKPWTIWQYSSNGKKDEYGTNGDVDLNVFNGTVEQLHEWANVPIVCDGGEDPEEPPVIEVPDPIEPEPEAQVWTGTIVSLDRMIVRLRPERADGTDTGVRMYPSQQVTGRLWVGNGYVWMKIRDLGWIAVREIGGYEFIRLDRQPDPAPPPVVIPAGMARLVWDDENPDYNFRSRTRMSWWSVPDNPPAVMRFYPEMREKSGDYRVNMASPYYWKPAIVDVNGGNVQAWKFLTGPHKATYNKRGWPQQAYITMAGNKLLGELAGKWYRFETLKPSDLAKVKGMTIETHPQFVHRFTCVTWDRKTRTTKHIESTGTPHGQVYFFLVTKEGIAYIPARHVVLP